MKCEHPKKSHRQVFIWKWCLYNYINP